MDLPYRSFGVISHKNGGGPSPAERRLLAHLRARYPSMPQVEVDKADLLLVFGGDGTLLDAVRTHSWRRPHILAFNCGHVGFLSSVREEGRFEEALDMALAGSLERLAIPPLRVQIERRNLGGVIDHAAVNDVTIECAMTWLTLRVEKLGEDGRVLIKEVRGSGLCVSSAIGSTAPLAAHLGAPPIDPSLRAFYLRGINDTRPPGTGLLLSGDGWLRVTLAGIEENAGIPEEHRRPPALFADGLHAGILHAGDVVTIRYGTLPSTLLRLPDDGHWNRIAKPL